MEDRYELRGKIGQGGIGRVYRAYDHRMMREVAIKRILTHQDEPSLKDEATKQLVTEAGALAALQHPNIITVHDVGSDDEGPYIVMELIAGKTLDQLIEAAPLNWDDFKSVVTQSLEALIAAHELNMIHCDLKPPNIMLTWLPSGSFQLKIVDFGLATIIQNQSPEEIAAMDSVFGSIFFMPPEQFERVPLDARSDMYSLGCCLYQALAGDYPFTGTTASEVMDAHQNHQVIPLQEVRSDIPAWACQWVMWLINRNPDDRPTNAREALANFVSNQKNDSAATSRVPAADTSEPDRPANATAATGLVSMPLTSTTAYHPTRGNPATHGRKTTSFTDTRRAATSGNEDLQDLTKGMKPLMAIGGAALGIAMLISLVVFIIRHNDRLDEEAAFEQVATSATNGNGNGLTAEQREVVFDYISHSTPGEPLDRAYDLLHRAAREGSANDYRAIVDFVTGGDVPPGVRPRLFRDVLAGCCRTETVPTLLDFCIRTRKADEAMAAFACASPVIRETDSGSLISIIAHTRSDDLRNAAEAEGRKLVRSSANKPMLAALIAGAKSNATPAATTALDRLLILCSENG